MRVRDSLQHIDREIKELLAKSNDLKELALSRFSSKKLIFLYDRFLEADRKAALAAKEEIAASGAFNKNNHTEVILSRKDAMDSYKSLKDDFEWALLFCLKEGASSVSPTQINKKVDFARQTIQQACLDDFLSSTNISALILEGIPPISYKSVRVTKGCKKIVVEYEFYPSCFLRTVEIGLCELNL